MRTLTEGLNALQRLDLSKVARKLMEPKPEGQGWTAEQVAEAEKWYRRFLELGIRYPQESIVPNFPIDTFWHQHILDTRAYATDCDAIFGEMMHHYPYFGLNGAQDAANRDAAFDRTNELYMLHFGEDCTHMRGFTKQEVPEDCMVSLHGDDGSHVRANNREEVLLGSGCNHGGSGTGCGQGCGKKVTARHDEPALGFHPLPSQRGMALAGMNCGGGGSGTGCRQGCSRGG